MMNECSLQRRSDFTVKGKSEYSIGKTKYKVKNKIWKKSELCASIKSNDLATTVAIYGFSYILCREPSLTCLKLVNQREH